MLRRLLPIGCVFAAGAMGIAVWVFARQSGNEVALPTAASGDSSEWTTSVKVTQDMLVYDGPISEEGASRFIELAQSEAVKAVRMNSSGGDYEAALKMGRVLRDRGLMLSVRICVSACADPLFIMARRKSVESGGFLAVHGTPAFNSDVAAKNGIGDAKSNSAVKNMLNQLFARRVAMLQNYADSGFDVRFHLPYLQFLARQNEFYANDTVRNLHERRGCPRAQLLALLNFKWVAGREG
ncbi:hypothetical protein [Roseateles saccharophilus]|uniref:ClpP protease-like protein n=1 Tax=Roseateles saccharophilus TaxID=304 RepID=A0A4R3U9N9_ROSSA|nr:hypothetical protein [Roseateles saccharophilus]MDG0835872.1 hypothetical protein [Roseateles saccharophilus]TCU83052.1 hypothetical protein EV671_10602 [Roseateles saccharophilus]